MSTDLFESMMESPSGRRVMEMYADAMVERDGYASTAQWECEDGWLVLYTTERITGGPHDGKFLCQAFKPYGKGARTNPQHWKEVYRREFAKRKSARARAEVLFYKHSPKRAAKHGRAT